MQLKLHVPLVQAGIELGTLAQLRQAEPQAVTVPVGTQLPPQKFVFAGHEQVFRMVSQICPPAQFAFDAQPKVQVLVRGSQNQFGGQEPGVWVHIDGTARQALLSQYWPAPHDMPQAPQFAKSLRVLTHEVPQRVRPVEHERLEPPPDPPPMPPSPAEPPPVLPPVPPPTPVPPPVLFVVVQEPLWQAWPVLQVRQSRPPAPQAAMELPIWHSPFASQQPVLQVAALQRRTGGVHERNATGNSAARTTRRMVLTGTPGGRRRPARPFSAIKPRAGARAQQRTC